MVTVASGQVSIASPERVFSVDAGQQWQLTAQQIWQPVEVNYQPMAWLQGLLIADNMRLDELLSYLNRYHYTYISLADTLADIKVSGVYKLDDLSLSMLALSQILAIDISHIGKFLYRIKPS